MATDQVNFTFALLFIAACQFVLQFLLQKKKQTRVRPQLATHPDARGDLEVFVNEALGRTGQEISKGTIIKPGQIRGSKKMGPLKTRLSLKESINLMLHSGGEDDGKAERHRHGNLTYE